MRIVSAERGRRHAEFGGEVHARIDDDFGARNVTFDPRRAQFLHAAHLGDDRARMFFERDRIVAADDHRDVAARKAARLALERHPRIGDRRQLGLQAAFPFDAGNLTIFFERDKAVSSANIDVVECRLNCGAVVENRADLAHDGFALRQRRTRRQLITHLTVIAVGRRLELLRQHHEQADARQEGKQTDTDNPDAMVVEPRPSALDHKLRPMGESPIAHPNRIGDSTEQNGDQANGKERDNRHERRQHHEMDCRIWAILPRRDGLKV